MCDIYCKVIARVSLWSQLHARWFDLMMSIMNMMGSRLVQAVLSRTHRNGGSGSILRCKICNETSRQSGCSSVTV